ncbi:hypothetical protein ACF0H5_014274 [Mactra antiquata]
MAERMRDIQSFWRCLPYFHDNFKSTDDVARFIKKNAKHKSGSFLLRPSSRNPDLLTASMHVSDGSVRHTHISVEEDSSIRGAYKFFLVVEKKFDSVQSLVEYYKNNPVRNLENVNDVYFSYPILNPRRSSRPVHVTRSQTSLNESSSSSSGIGPPPLPIRPGPGGSMSSCGSDVSLSTGKKNELRPPCPLPDEAKADYDRLMYSRPRDTEVDISENLKDALKLTERCECGIPRILAELPLGWTVHQSRELQTRGKLFYQSPDEKTYWQLPQQVEMQLTRTHKNNLQKIDKDWGTRRSTATLNGRV